MSELETCFSPAGDSTRNAIWKEFEEETSLVKHVYGKVAAVWLGGSFITSETQPHDIDVVYLIDKDSYDQAIATSEGQFITQILLRENATAGRIKPLVDAYLFPVPPTEIENNYNYSVARGYWDQFWSKTRFASNNDRWLYPAAGYLEVIIDGYKR